MAMLIEPPTRLPVEHLSSTSIALFLKCPLRWRRRYIDGEQEPMSSSAVLGRAAGAAERDSWSRQIETGDRFSTPELLDAFSDAWALTLETEDVQWDPDERPGKIKDSGARVLPLYHRTIASTVKPIAVERPFRIEIPDVEWAIIGYFDVECDDEIPDLKMRSRTRGVVSAAEARGELQPSYYLAARRAEGNPARFAYHSVVRTAPGGEPRMADVAVTAAPRTDAQLDQAIELACQVAAEIDWRLQTDVWTPPPPGAWWCSKDWCPFWAGCEYGGALLPTFSPPGRDGDVHMHPSLRPRLPRRIPDQELYRALEVATTKTAGGATAEKVGRQLGISAVAAAGRLRNLPDVEAFQPTRKVDPDTGEPSRRKNAVAVPIPGPRLWRRVQPTPAQVLAGLEGMADDLAA